MNKARRKSIEEAINKIYDIQSILDDLKQEEEDARESLPESIQDGERGEAMQEAIDELEEAMEALGEAIDHAENAAN